MSTVIEIQAAVPQFSVLFPTLNSMYINDTTETPGVYLAYRKEGYVLRKLQRSLSSIET
jgi:hypothetical protein